MNSTNILGALPELIRCKQISSKVMRTQKWKEYCSFTFAKEIWEFCDAQGYLIFLFTRFRSTRQRSTQGTRSGCSLFNFSIVLFLYTASLAEPEGAPSEVAVASCKLSCLVPWVMCTTLCWACTHSFMNGILTSTYQMSSEDHYSITHVWILLVVLKTLHMNNNKCKTRHQKVGSALCQFRSFLSMQS